MGSVIVFIIGRSHKDLPEGKEGCVCSLKLRISAEKNLGRVAMGVAGGVAKRSGRKEVGKGICNNNRMHELLYPR